jgi:hypothetical protein
MYEYWNIFEVFAQLGFTSGMILRFVPDPNCFKAARIVLSFDLILWYFKSLQMYIAIKKMGPKLIMIKRMLVQLAMFMLIVLLFMFAFGICIQALTYHNVPLNWSLLSSVFLPAFFVLGGNYDNYIGYLMCKKFTICTLKPHQNNMKMQ